MKILNGPSFQENLMIVKCELRTPNLLESQGLYWVRCKTTIETHDKRHREIVDLNRALLENDQSATGGSPITVRKKPRRSTVSSNSDSSCNTEGPEKLNLEDCGNSSTSPFRHIPRRSTVSSSSDSSCNTEEGLGKSDLEDCDDSSALADDELDREDQMQPDFLHVIGHGNQAKAERKTAKHQADVRPITESDLKRLNLILHPDLASQEVKYNRGSSQGLTSHAVEDNITFNPQFHRYADLRLSVSEKNAIKANRHQQIRGLPEDPKEQKTLIDSILEKLGISVALKRSYKDRKACEKLRTLIFNDLVSAANEAACTMERMAGYWRYVNRRQYNHMIRTNEIWDWATGAKLPEIEEETDICESDESESEGSDGTLSGSTVLGSSGPSSPTAELEKAIVDFKWDGGEEKGELKTPIQLTKILDISSTTFSQRDCANSLTIIPEQHLEPTLTCLASSTHSIHDLKKASNIDLSSHAGDITPTSILQGPTFKDPWTISSPSAKSAECNEHQAEDPSSLLRDVKSPLTPQEDRNLTNQPQPRRVLSLPPKTAPVAKDKNNRFRGLKIEQAAPREEDDISAPITARRVPPIEYTPPVVPIETSDSSELSALPSSTVGEKVEPLEQPKAKSISISLTVAEHFQAMETVAKGKKRKGKGAKEAGRGAEGGGGKRGKDGKDGGKGGGEGDEGEWTIV